MGVSERGEPLNLCGAELEKLLLSENQTPYLLRLLAPVIFLEKKKDLHARRCNEDWRPSQRANVVFLLSLFMQTLFREYTSTEGTVLLLH